MNLFAEAKKVLDKDGKVNALGPYGKQKLTGREIQTYFRRNKVKDKVVRKAVEVALDLGGAMDIAIKAIRDFYGNKILKAKEVQTALKFANEESFKDSFDTDLNLIRFCFLLDTIRSTMSEEVLASKYGKMFEAIRKKKLK